MTLAERLETIVMAHRYLYYVMDNPSIPDAAYDHLERQARAACSPTSSVHSVGSSLASSYTVEQRQLAMKLGETK